ncbi:hypothetical protein AMECASPLE_001778 [Ameca splendens]|uniref:Secreted protein n=1 Tax=Ameca splendens TaxID=208324 RepID=A0ABV0XXX5_9TELE
MRMCSTSPLPVLPLLSHGCRLPGAWSATCVLLIPPLHQLSRNGYIHTIGLQNWKGENCWYSDFSHNAVSKHNDGKTVHKYNPSSASGLDEVLIGSDH